MSLTILQSALSKVESKEQANEHPGVTESTVEVDEDAEIVSPIAAVVHQPASQVQSHHLYSKTALDKI